MTLEMGKKERKKDTRGNEKMKMSCPQVGFEPTTLCTPDKCSYQLNHQRQQSWQGPNVTSHTPVQDNRQTPDNTCI